MLHILCRKPAQQIGCEECLSLHRLENTVELEGYLPLQVYGFTGITEMWWHSPHDRIIARDEYRLFEGQARETMVRGLFKPLL